MTAGRDAGGPRQRRRPAAITCKQVARLKVGDHAQLRDEKGRLIGWGPLWLDSDDCLRLKGEGFLAAPLVRWDDGSPCDEDWTLTTGDDMTPKKCDHRIDYVPVPGRDVLSSDHCRRRRGHDGPHVGERSTWTVTTTPQPAAAPDNDRRQG